MSKFIISTCLLLFWGFYEMSGGADFVPLKREVVERETVTASAPPPVMPAPRPAEPQANVITAAYSTELVIIPAPVVEDVMLVASTQPGTAIHAVNGDWVNMRTGPSTSFDVLDTLPRGTKAEILELNDDGWAQIRLIDGEKTGWMAARLLSKG